MRIHTCIHIMVFIYEGSCTTCVKGTVAPLRKENEIAWNAFPDKCVLAVTQHALLPRCSEISFCCLFMNCRNLAQSTLQFSSFLKAGYCYLPPTPHLLYRLSFFVPCILHLFLHVCRFIVPLQDSTVCWLYLILFLYSCISSSSATIPAGQIGLFTI